MLCLPPVCPFSKFIFHRVSHFDKSYIYIYKHIFSSLLLWEPHSLLSPQDILSLLLWKPPSLLSPIDIFLPFPFRAPFPPFPLRYFPPLSFGSLRPSFSLWYFPPFPFWTHHTFSFWPPGVPPPFPLLFHLPPYFSWSPLCLPSPLWFSLPFPSKLLFLPPPLSNHNSGVSAKSQSGNFTQFIFSGGQINQSNNTNHRRSFDLFWFI